MSSAGVFDALDEAIGIGADAGVHVQVVHVKLSGLDNWGRAGALLARLEAARAGGVRIDCDQYPYTAASNPLKNLLPPWVQSDDVEEMIVRLADPAARARIRTEIAAAGLTNFGRIPDWDAIRISVSPHRQHFAGRTIADIAREEGAEAIDCVCDYLIADRCATRVLVTSIGEEDVRTLIRSPEVCVGSDGNCVAPYGITGQGKPHPRFYGTFPRILGHYVRELGLVPLPVAIHKMTGAPATALGPQRARPAARGVLCRRDDVRSRRLRRAGELCRSAPISGRRGHHGDRQRQRHGRSRRAHRRARRPPLEAPDRGAVAAIWRLR